MFFRSVSGNVDRGLSTDRTFEVGVMTEGNIPGTHRKNTYFCIYSPYVKNLPNGT